MAICEQSLVEQVTNSVQNLISYRAFEELLLQQLQQLKQHLQQPQLLMQWTWP